jgi:hypothetical protein
MRLMPRPALSAKRSSRSMWQPSATTWHIRGNIDLSGQEGSISYERAISSFCCSVLLRFELARLLLAHHSGYGQDPMHQWCAPLCATSPDEPHHQGSFSTTYPFRHCSILPCRLKATHACRSPDLREDEMTAQFGLRTARQPDLVCQAHCRFHAMYIIILYRSTFLVSALLTFLHPPAVSFSIRVFVVPCSSKRHCNLLWVCT